VVELLEASLGALRTATPYLVRVHFLAKNK
jgi:hypothetical protein